ncbi:MAG: sulfite exporter TauE/SafE family protein [Pseudomonadota bacterium]
MGVLETIAPLTLILAFTIVLVAGVVKGAIGFAMPLIMVSGLGSLMDPKLAIAAILFPIVFSNLLQTFRQGYRPAIDALQDTWRYVLTVCIAIFIAAQWVPNIPTNIFYWILGVPVVILSLLQLFGINFYIAEIHRRWTQWVAGVLSGALGGLAGTWGPVTVLYLLATKTPKAKQIIVQGVVYGAGSFTLFVAHLQSGILNRDTAPLSLAMLPIALIGMYLGFKIHDMLDQALFRKITLIVLVIAGLNLLRRGVILSV